MQTASRKRVVLTWRPEWNSKIENWTKYQITKNLWRFDTIDGPDDVMQQARILFWQLGQRYPDVIEPSHFFALYKTSLLRKFHDKARARQRSIIDQEVVAEDVAMGMESSMPNYGHIKLLLEEMPDELKTVLSALTTGRVRLKLDRPTTQKRLRNNHNMRLRKRFSLNSTDPVGDLRAYFNTNS